jgi:uncharacterized membrane protein
MFSTRNQIIQFIDNGIIPEDRIPAALIASKVTPDADNWRIFIDRLLLWLGGLALAFAVMFFIAFNWTEFGHFAKFGMVEGLIALAVGAYCLLSENRMGAKVLLLMATILVGVLLALYGQTYQTGADPWQLFFYWGMLILPWAIIGRFSAIWIVWVALMNTSIVLYFDTFGRSFWFIRSELDMLWLTFAFNTVVLVIWELLAGRWDWLSDQWAIRLIAVCSGSSITWLILNAIIEEKSLLIIFGAWLPWLIFMYLGYRKLRPDLFMLAGMCLSAITIAIPLLGMVVLKDFNPGGILLLALMTIGMGAGAAFWLKQVHQEIQS